MAFQSKGIHGYNRVSQSQLQVALKFVPAILSSLESVKSLSSDTIRVVDYGCCEGQNSMITFSSVFKKFRESHSNPVSILHTDLPENNWVAVFNSINLSDESYLNLEKVFYSTLGRSFFNQLVPNESVHLGYTSYAMHYLSQKQPRDEGEFGWAFNNAKIQGSKDIRHLIDLRINELVTGGVFVMIINARELIDQDPSFARYNFGSVKRLLDRGLVEEREFRNYVWHSYPYHLSEIDEIIAGFQDRVEVLHREYGKIHFPYYADYLVDKDIEKFKTSMTDMMRVMMKNPLFTALERPETEKQEVLETALKEIESMIHEELPELFQDYICLIFKKLPNPSP